MQKPNIVKARVVIPIFYSSVTNTSKKIAYMLQDKLEEQKFIANVTNIGNIDKEDFLQISGPIIMIMSTYGNGGSPADGEQFVDWLTLLQKQNHFEHLQFVMLGLGNRSFQHFCGNSVKIRQFLLDNGAKQLIDFVKCNSSSQEQTAIHKFPEWSKNLINLLKQRYEIKQIKAQDFLQQYKAVIVPEEIKEDEWLRQKQIWSHKLGKQFLNYHNSFNAEVIHIKQLRKVNDKRSTLWVRIKQPEGFTLQPACNLSIYPENIRQSGQSSYKGSIKIQSKKKNPKFPFPPMPLQRLWAISNLNQICDINTLKYAVAVSHESQQVKLKYRNLLRDVEEFQKQKIRNKQVYQQLKPGFDYLIRLGINTIRPYTLASWEPQKGYFDLIVSIDPLGLTSRYLKSNPSFLKISHCQSAFYVAEGRPIVMIANGTGIAPFRSLAQFYLNKNQYPQLYLYFGIQNKQVDFYFRQQWEAWQKQGKIKLRIAESRKDEAKKVYIQDLVKEDKSFFCKHLFQNKGLIFICGGTQMAKQVDTQIFQAIKLKQKIPFKAFKLSKQLQKNKTIVKEVFH